MGNIMTTHILLLILCFAVVSFIQIRVVRAQGTIYIRSDGNVEGTDKLQRDGNIYTFLGNISIDGSGTDGFIVERDNIVIDGADYTLQLTGEMKFSKGITLMERSNVTIKNLRILNFNYGIQLQNSSGNTLSTNYIHPIGIKVNGSHNNTIIENHLVGRGGDGTGIVMDIYPDYGNSTGNQFLGNNITEQGVGINSIVGSANIISGNDITNCTIYGIFLTDYPNSLIIGNTFENNVIGIFFSHGASNNIIYDNNFVNNQKDVDDAHSILPTVYGLSVNSWDNGSRGNYWSNYNGTDDNGDGIGDSPHFVYENNQDNYPLMNPVDIEEFIIPEFPSMTILLLLLMVIFATVIYKKKLISKG